MGLAILFGVGFSDDQIAGILLVVSTGLALGTYVVQNRGKLNAKGGSS